MLNNLLKVAKEGKGTRVDLESRRTSLSSDRETFLSRSEDYARMTLPYLLPLNGAGSQGVVSDRGEDANQHGFDSVGSQLTNSLSNRLALTLFPPQSSFFRMDFSEDMAAELEEQGYKLTELAQIVSVGETRAMKVFAARNCRVAVGNAMKHLIVAGNVSIFIPPEKDKPVQAIPLNRYFTKRDRSGFLIEYMQEDYKMYNTLSEDIKNILKAHKQYKETDNLKLLTWAYWYEDKYHIIQTIENFLIEDVKTVDKSDLPWICLMWNHAYGEDYGRGLVEDNVGDFYVMEFLSEARATGAAIMADIKYLIKQGSTIDMDELIGTPSGECLYGDLDDIGILQLQKYADYTPITAILSEYEQRLGKAFLVNSAQRRDAERVTAYELRLDAQELETSLGGVYSLLASTFQAPLAYYLFKEIDFPLDSTKLEPMILTGLEALGRGSDLQKIIQYSEMMALPASWAKPLQERLKWMDYSDSVLASLSLEAPWLMSDEEFAEKQSAEAEAQSNAVIGAEAAKAVPTIIENQMEA